jgi:four helix bundle protein
VQDFENLLVWRKAHALALDVFRATQRRSRTGSASLRSQLRRAAISIPANIAEGCGHEGPRELARFLQISMASATETEYHLRLCHDLDVLTRAEYATLVGSVKEVKKMLATLIQRVRARAAAGTGHGAQTSKKPPVASPLTTDG